MVVQLMPLFILGLSLPDNDIRTSVIDTLFGIAKDDSSQRTALAEHATTIITILLQNVLPEGASSTVRRFVFVMALVWISSSSTYQKLRIAALRCLGVLPNSVPYDALHPHRNTVTRQLGKALDDPKREVRRMAVDTRAVW